MNYLIFISIKESVELLIKNVYVKKREKSHKMYMTTFMNMEFNGFLIFCIYLNFVIGFCTDKENVLIRNVGLL